MKEIMSNPSSGKVLIQTMKDASGRWSGWSKMSNKTAPLGVVFTTSECCHGFAMNQRLKG